MIMKEKLLSLIGVALFCGILWRLELEYRGWEGLRWLSYYQLSPLIGLGLFMLWANYFVDCTREQRIWINLATIFYCGCLYVELSFLSVFPFMRSIDWLNIALACLFYISIPVIPIGGHLILKSFKKKVSNQYLLLSILGMSISPFIVMILLELMGHKGGSDFIHAIKSGFLIPFWVFFLGLPIVGHQNKENTQPYLN